ncbi:hypothetical protein DFJ74DRAFT_704381 [Hyaloraphidium curvatum]|nr:hypothetical protein DFJ74DRAFT_704381 [Hyaloraphidium curvatum]
MIPTSASTAREVAAVFFSFYSHEELRKVSVKQITNPQIFDTLGHPMPGGLYDGALGPFERSDTCATCGLSYFSCPGHFGHIELVAPCFNPTTFATMYRLLKSKCLYCHHFRTSRVLIHHFAAKYRLLQAGLYLEAIELDDFMDKKTLAPGAKGLGGEKDQKRGKNRDEEEGGEEDVAEAGPPRTAEEIIQAIEGYVEECLTRSASGFKGKTTASAGMLRALERDFYRAVPQNCQNCRASNPGFRKEGYLKVFEKKESDKMRRKNEGKGLTRTSILDFVNAATKEQQAAKAVLATEGAGTSEASPSALVDDEAEESSEAEEDDEMMDQDSEDEDMESTSEAPARATVSKTARKPTGDRYLTPLEIKAHMELLWSKETMILDLVFGHTDPRTLEKKSDPSIFFFELIPVAPTKFRPASKMGDQTYDHPQNTNLTKILKANVLLADLRAQNAPGDRMLRTWMDLQGEINALFDTSKAGDKAKNSPPGIRQILEKKEGLFRKHMMGKRVNYAARSVISPDVMVEGNEIGIPPYFATRLTYPSPVTPHNVHILRQAVINGPKKWPGATHIQQEDGNLVSLAYLDEVARTALANSLLTSPHTAFNSPYANVPKVVHRHLVNGDFLLLNRQPTLHKPSIMCHTARILKGEKTLRMHYANCNTYNADFDGDEMNVHFPQNEVARAEAMLIARNDLQYLVPTSGGVLRGLIQDHVDAGVHMCDKRTLFTKDEVMQLVYAALRPEGGVGHGGVGDGNVEEEVQIGRRGRIIMIPPAIIKPVLRWTGKQVISIVLLNITATHKPLNLVSKARVSAKYWHGAPEEERVEFMDGELLTGVLDKNQFGASADGVVHAVYEVYGARYAGKLLTVLGRLFTTYLQHRGFTCGIDDLRLTGDGDKKRRSILSQAPERGREAALEFARISVGRGQPVDKSELRDVLEKALRSDDQMKALDSAFKSAMNKLTTEAIGACMPNYLDKLFPENGMQLMTVAGAKGSAVNTSQITVCLGQQELEGRRVPTMVSGKTLPSFRPFETNPIAGGYVAGRFLTGIRPQEYYFHCMAGREGLIDTAVKTSRSGYLQRCLIKHLEGLKVHYDSTVRDADGSVVQFYYGEDSLDVMKQKSLTNFKLWAMNYGEIVDKVKPAEIVKGGRVNTSPEIEAQMKEAVRSPDAPTTMSIYSPSKHLGSTSERFAKELDDYIKKDPDGLLGKSDDKAKKKSRSNLNGRKFRSLMQLKYLLSLVDPGEAVGVLAGQGVGEPSTQMTLNTFHFAGFGAANVTLGIPRLRELLMTASTRIKTPLMTLPLLPHVTEQEKLELCSQLSRLVLSQITKSVEVQERISKSSTGARLKTNVVRIQFWSEEEYGDEFGLTKAQLEAVLEKRFVQHLYRAIDREFKKFGVKVSKSKDADDGEIGKPQKRMGDGIAPARRAGGDDDDERAAGPERDEDDGAGARAQEPDSDEDDDEGDDREEDEEANEVYGTPSAARGGSKATYDAPDEDEEELIRAARREAGDLGDDDEDLESGTNPSQRHATGSGDGESLAEDQEEEERDHKGRTAEERVLASTKHISRYLFDRRGGSWVEVHLSFDSDAHKLLMLGLVESVLGKVVIQEIPGISKVFPVDDNGGKDGVQKLTVEGVNLHGIWDHPDSIDVDRIYTNDIGAVLRTYGVEAARAAIISEMAQVFGVYGIAVDRRHLSLIADYMTFAGGYKPFNRMGMMSNPAPFAQMSYETTMQFLTAASLSGDYDGLSNPSSRLVMGQVVKGGTGAFEILSKVGDFRAEVEAKKSPRKPLFGALRERAVEIVG